MFGLVNFFLRLIFTFFLVFATYNPSGRSFYHWMHQGEAPATIIMVVAISIFAAYGFLIRATWRSIKPLGALLIVIFLLLFNIMLVDIGVVGISQDWVPKVMALSSFAVLLAIGVSFSAIRARLSGQIDSDDVGH